VWGTLKGWRSIAATSERPIVSWFGMTESAQCGAYCAVTVVGMLGLMRCRRDVYSTHPVHSA
jgi:hypothetical protein